MNSGHSKPEPLPPDLKVILEDLEKSDQEARRMIGGVTEAQANWQPRDDAWRIAQCLDHLGRTNAIYAASLSAALEDPRAAGKLRGRAIQPGWFSRFFIRALEPPPKRKLRAPKKIVPVSRANKGDVLQAFLRSQEDMRAVIRKSADLDLNRIRFRSPFIGFLRFSVGAGLLVVAAHDRRHLWQAEQVRTSAEFPQR
jgi:hypothetical protein